MLNEIKKIAVFFIRDIRMFYTYKLAFSVTFLGMIFNFFYLVLFGSMFGSAELPYLPAAYEGDFISYILVGTIGWSFLWSIMGATGTSLRNEMVMGTFESILITPTKIYTIIISYALFGSLFGLISTSSLLIIGYFFFGFTAFASANIFTLIIFILSALMMMGFGMIFGGLTIWVKNIEGTIPLLQNIVTFFCGVYFPIAVLPEVIRGVHIVIPFFYSIQGLRMSLIQSTPSSELFFYVEMLIFFVILFNTIGLLVLKLGLKKAKRDGSLSYY
jgi:ABC-2 type transport system permease protein